MSQSREQEVRTMLAWVFGCAPDQLSWEEIRAARAVLVYQAANKSKPNCPGCAGVEPCKEPDQ